MLFISLHKICWVLEEFQISRLFSQYFEKLADISHSRSCSQMLGTVFIIPVPIPECREQYFLIPFPFPNVGNSISNSRSCSQMHKSHSCSCLLGGGVEQELEDGGSGVEERKAWRVGMRWGEEDTNHPSGPWRRPRRWPGQGTGMYWESHT